MCYTTYEARLADRSLTTKMKVELDYKESKADEVKIEKMKKNNRVIVRVGNTVIDICSSMTHRGNEQAIIDIYPYKAKDRFYFTIGGVH